MTLICFSNFVQCSSSSINYIKIWRKDVLFGTLIISDNELPLLTENIFQTPIPPFIWTPLLPPFDSQCNSNGFKTVPANISMFKVNKRYTRKRCEICSKLTIKTPERRQWRHSGVFVINFEHISQFFLVYLLLTLNKEMLAGVCVLNEFFPTHNLTNLITSRFPICSWLTTPIFDQ